MGSVTNAMFFCPKLVKISCKKYAAYFFLDLLFRTGNLKVPVEATTLRE
jgi:hypothetical protein